jgi:hypothetical protein
LLSGETASDYRNKDSKKNIEKNFQGVLISFFIPYTKNVKYFFCNKAKI